MAAGISKGNQLCSQLIHTLTNHLNDRAKYTVQKFSVKSGHVLFIKMLTLFIVINDIHIRVNIIHNSQVNKVLAQIEFFSAKKICITKVF